ncbi:MAG UNVERIFIED_CONTAM: hypothetical protein LVR18_05650 [Planctomycetaceae bacterium]
MERQPISREGYDKLREEVRLLEEVEMPAVAERIKTAREEGDLKENAEYHSAQRVAGAAAGQNQSAPQQTRQLLHRRTLRRPQRQR